MSDTDDRTTERVSAEFMARRIRSAANRLRSLADDLERHAKDAETVGQPQRPSSYAQVASTVQHDLLWGMANMGLDGLTTDAWDADAARITVEPADTPALATPEPATCAIGDVRSAVECDGGPLDWRVRYYVGIGKTRKAHDVLEPMCRAHAQHEEQWTNAVGAIRYGIAEKIQEG